MHKLECAECFSAIDPNSDYWLLFLVGVSRKVIYNPWRLANFTVVCPDHFQEGDLLSLDDDCNGLNQREKNAAIYHLYEQEDELIFAVIRSAAFSGESCKKREYERAVYISGSNVKKRMPNLFSSLVRDMQSIWRSAMRWLAYHNEAC